MRATYHVRYRYNGEEKGIDVAASNKAEAYDIATFEVLPEIEGSCPYSSWVESLFHRSVVDTLKNLGRYSKWCCLLTLREVVDTL